MCCQTNKHCDRDCTADQQGKASENKKKYFLECLHLAGIFLQWRKSWRSGMALAVNLVSGYSCCLPSVVRFRLASQNIPWRSASLSRWTIAGGIYFLANVPGQTCGPCAIEFMGSLNRIVCSRWLGSVFILHSKAYGQTCAQAHHPNRNQTRSHVRSNRFLACKTKI